MSRMTRSWCYTINNYTDDDVVRLEALKCIRHVCGKEVGESGTPHLQGYVRFEKPQRFSWWKNQFPTAHVEMRKGKESQASAYCIKEGNVVINKGYDCDEEAPRKRTRDEEADEVIKEIEDGERYGQIRQRHKRFCFWHRRNIIDYMYDERRLNDDDNFDPTINEAPSRRM